MANDLTTLTVSQLADLLLEDVSKELDAVVLELVNRVDVSGKAFIELQRDHERYVRDTTRTIEEQAGKIHTYRTAALANAQLAVEISRNGY